MNEILWYPVETICTEPWKKYVLKFNCNRWERIEDEVWGCEFSFTGVTRFGDSVDFQWPNALCDFSTYVATPWSWWLSVFPDPTISNFTIGDIVAGVTNIGGKTAEQLWLMAQWYLEPLFTAFNLSAFNPWALREMGNPYSLSGSQTFTWAISTPWNVQPNSLTIRDMTAGVDLWIGLANDGSEALNIGSITLNPVSPWTVTRQWRITGQDTNLAPIGWPNLRTVSTNFVYPTFAGLVTNISDLFTGITRAGVLALPMNLLVVPRQNNTTVTSPVSQRFAIAYPASYGVLASILDNSLFETISDYATGTFNVTSMLDWATVSYRYYILNNLTSQTAFSNQFRF